MRRPQLRSLKSLLLAHELAFLFLVIVAGALGGTWAYFWQRNAAEQVRLSQLIYSSLQIRSDLFRQIKEVTYARLTENTDALALYGDYSRQIDRHFNTLRQLAGERDEQIAVQAMQKAYRVLQADMNNIFLDPYLISRVVPLRILDLQYEQTLVGDFEVALRGFEQILRAKQARVDATLAKWTRYAPILLPLPILIAIALIVAARRWLRRGFVQPLDAVMSGARLISKGDLSHVIPRGGVQEMIDLEEAINQMAVDLARSRDALIESERSSALGALIPVVAHNIRNPLASIRASAQLLDHADQPEDTRDIKQAIIDTVDRLGRWVSALVSYLHPLKPQPVPRSLTALLDAAIGLLQNRLHEKDIRVERAEWDDAETVMVDPDLMEQALYALLSNAVDASPEGGAIAISAGRRGGKFLVCIEDNGPGLPFEPQPTGLAPGPSTKRFGTGLGIPVAFKVCNAHGWKLRFERSENGGTRVTIAAPLAIQTEAAQHA